MTTAASGGWAARIPLADAGAAAALRLVPGVEAAHAGEHVWLRGQRLDDATDAALRRVPGLERFHVVAPGLLARDGESVPSASLPDADWTPVASAFPWTLPAPVLPGAAPERVALRVVRSSAERATAALVTTSDVWRDWCATAPQVRLDPLRFAACRDGRVLVLGEPLPPIPAALPHWIDAGVLAPCGVTTSPDLGGEVLRRVLGVPAGDFALLRIDGSFDIVPAAAFCAATRGAARATHAAMCGTSGGRSGPARTPRASRP